MEFSFNSGFLGHKENLVFRCAKNAEHFLACQKSFIQHLKMLVFAFLCIKMKRFISAGMESAFIIKLTIEDTKKACVEYNKLKKQNKKVNTIMHSTC